MNQSESVIPETVYKKALPEINKIEGFESLSFDELNGMSLNYMPFELSDIVKKCLAEWEKEQSQFNPKVKYTISTDNIHCGYCGSELIVKHNDYDGYYKQCPLPSIECRTFKNLTGVDFDKNESMLDSFENKVEFDFAYSPRRDEQKTSLDEIKKVLIRNKKNLITSSYKFGHGETINQYPRNHVTVLFNGIPMLKNDFNKKDGSVLECFVCEHELENINTDETLYKIVSITEVGTLQRRNQTCCVKTEYQMKDVEWIQDPIKREEALVTLNNNLELVKTYRVTYQRLTSHVEKAILKTMERIRMYTLNPEYIISARIHEIIHKESVSTGKSFFTYRDLTGLKRQISASCKKLAKEGKLESSEIEHEFNPERTESGSQSTFKINDESVIVYHTNKQFVGDATKLNTYRFPNPYAIKLSDEDYEMFSNASKTWHDRYNDDDKRKSARATMNEIFSKYKVIFGVDNGIYVNRHFNEVHLYCEMKDKSKLMKNSGVGNN